MGGSPSTLPPLRFPRGPAHAGSLGAGACGLSRRQSTRAALGKELVLSPRGRIRLHLRVARRRSRPSAKIDTFGSIHNGIGCGTGKRKENSMRPLLQELEQLDREELRLERWREKNRAQYPNGAYVDAKTSRVLDRKSTRLNSSHGYIS